MKSVLVALLMAATIDAHGSLADGVDAPPEDVDILHYAVELSPDFEAHSISGRTVISFRILRDGVRDIRLSANALTIDEAAAGRQGLQVSKDKNDLVVTLPRPMARGSRATIALTYHGVPARGLVFGRRSVYSSYFACDWMFCTQDRPGDKATIDLTLMLPKGMTSLGIGTLHSIAPASPGIEAHAWREERPYSSYIYGFAAGALHVASERQGPVELRYLSEDASPERLRALFAGTGRMVRFFEEKAGVPLPHSRYTQVLVAGSAAQESATFSVVGEDEVSSILEHPQEDWAIAHELAHQWWGNLVTCTEWSEFWLNEGITTFMVAAWKEHAWGRAAYDREMELARRRLETANKAGIDVPLTYRGAYPSLSLRRAIQYSKGALFMDRLRQELGDGAFWPALRSFTRAHAGKTVESRDFQRAFEVETRRDLAPLFNEWVY